MFAVSGDRTQDPSHDKPELLFQVQEIKQRQKNWLRQRAASLDRETSGKSSSTGTSGLCYFYPLAINLQSLFFAWDDSRSDYTLQLKHRIGNCQKRSLIVLIW